MGCANGGVLPALRDGLLSEERDPFRNPMGDALRRNLSQLLHELFGEMDATAIDSALDPIIRLQVVQGFAPDDAVRFVSLLKDLLREDGPEQNSEALGGSLDSRRIDNARIDRLADIAAGQVRTMPRTTDTNPGERGFVARIRCNTHPREATRMKALTPLLAVLAIVALAALGGLAHASLVLLAVFVPYSACAVFLIGFCYRVVRWAWAPCRSAFPPRAASRSRCLGSSPRHWTTPVPDGRVPSHDPGSSSVPIALPQ